MKAMVCEAFGGPEVLALRDVPDPPPPGPGEMQVRIEARGVQYVDVLMLAGKYQFRPEPPFIPGGEAAGVVVAVGLGVTDFRVGDRVMSRHSLGACAELGNAKAALCDHVPAEMEHRGRGRFSRRLCHRVSCAVAARAHDGGRVGAGSRRRRRYRHCRDPGGEAVRRPGDRDRQHRGKAQCVPGRRRGSCDRLCRRVRGSR